MEDRGHAWLASGATAFLSELSRRHTHLLLEGPVEAVERIAGVLNRKDVVKKAETLKKKIEG